MLILLLKFFGEFNLCEYGYGREAFIKGFGVCMLSFSVCDFLFVFIFFIKVFFDVDVGVCFVMVEIGCLMIDVYGVEYT